MEDLKPGFYFITHKLGADPVVRLLIINGAYTHKNGPWTYAIVVNTQTFVFSKYTIPEELHKVIKEWDITPL